MVKVQLTLTDQEHALLASYGEKLGYSLSKTIRFIIGNKAEELLFGENIPTFEMSEKREKMGLQALKEHKAGKTIVIKDIDRFFRSL
jgi:hypothetical protein